MSYFTWIKNRAKLMSLISQTIDFYESSYQGFGLSCKNDLVKAIEKDINRSKEEIANWQDYDTDYLYIAHVMIQTTSFEMLSSGMYNSGRGTLAPHTCAKKMLHVHNKCLESAMEHKWITEEDFEETKTNLRLNILDNF